MTPEPIVDVEDLRVRFGGASLFGRKKSTDAVRGVSFSIQPHETLALVGESGSGKTTTGRAILGLSPVVGGRVTVRGKNVDSKHSPHPQDVQMVYQNPYESLTPQMKIFDLVAEPLRVNRLAESKDEVADRVGELLELVGLPRQYWERLPRSMSGGQLQRVAIARALAVKPALLVADEPVAKLDVSIQAQVVGVLRDVQKELGMASLFITHNIALVRYVAQRVGIMYQGELVEVGEVSEVLHNPQHEYTRTLLAAVPRVA